MDNDKSQDIGSLASSHYKISDAPSVLFYDTDRISLNLYRHSFKDDFNLLLSDDIDQCKRILDFQTPDAAIIYHFDRYVEGKPLMEYIRSHHPSIPIIGSSSDREFLKDSLRKGLVDDYFMRPTVPTDIKRIVSSYLSSDPVKSKFL